MLDYSTVYKYRNFEIPNHRKILFENELFLASPSSFNDTFDCRIPLNLDLLDTDSKRREYVERIYSRDKNNIAKTEALKKNEIEGFCRLLKERPLECQKMINKLTFETQDNILGVISFSFEWDNPLLWGHYSNSHKGICIGFNREKLENSKIFYCGGSVNYSIDFPLLDPLKSIERSEINNQIFTKSKEWEYEKEYRLVKLFDSYFEDRPTDERKIRIPNYFFSEIILGYNFPNRDLKEVLNIAKDKRVPVFKLLKQYNSYKMKKEEISN